MARGRKVNSNGEKSKQLLMEKAIELFSTHGYHQTKISDIVKAANVTQPTFYLYFQSKESLFKDLNEKFQTNLFDIFSLGIDQTRSEIRDVKHLMLKNISSIFNYFLENPGLTKIGFYESDESHIVKNELVDVLVSTLDNERGEFIALNYVDSKTLAESLLGSMERLTLTKLLTNEQNPEKLAEDIVNIYFIE